MAITRTMKRALPAAVFEELPPAKRIKKAQQPATLEELVANAKPKKSASSSTSNDASSYARRIKKDVSHLAAVKKKKAFTSQVNGSWKHMPASFQKGMYNPAVLCYRNSLLQSLFHQPKFVNWAREHLPKDCVHDGKKPCVACPLQELVNAYWGGGVPALHHALFSYQKAVAANGGASGDLAGQADPAELLFWLTKTLGGQLPPSEFSIFQAFSSTLLCTTMECKKCGHVTTTREVEAPILLEIKPHIKGGDVADYLGKHLKFIVEEYKCDECGNRGRKQRLRRISHSADVLVIQLKRFSWDGSKDSSTVAIPQILDLNQHRMPANKLSSKYHLSSVISHSGTAKFGHYICTAKDGDEKWHTFNDKNVSQTTAAAARHGGLKGFTPYLLFYQRK